MGLELLLALALAYAVVSPDRFSLAVTRGAAGATRGAASAGRASGARGRAATARTSPKASKAKSGKTSKGRGSHAATQRRPFDRLRTVASGAVAGWRDGVQSARTRRAEGRDIVGRTKRAAGWTARTAKAAHGKRKAKRDDKAAKLAAAATALKATPEPAIDPQQPATDPQPTATTPPAPDGTPTPKVSDPATETTPKGPDMTVTTTDLESLTAVQEETKNAQAALAEVVDVLASLKAWAASLPDRWSGTDWTTRDLDTAIGSVGESVNPQVDPDALGDALQAMHAAAERAKAVAEVADEVGAKGDVDHFRAS